MHIFLKYPSCILNYQVTALINFLKALVNPRCILSLAFSIKLSNSISMSIVIETLNELERKRFSISSNTWTKLDMEYQERFKMDVI